MSLESYDLTSIASIEDDQKQSKTKKIIKNGFIVITKHQFIAMMMTIILVYGISLIAISIQSKKELNSLRENFIQFSTKPNSDNSFNSHEAFDVHDPSFESNPQFEKIAQFGYFKKLAKKMNYRDGQKECSKLSGHIIEGEFKSKYVFIGATKRFAYFLIFCIVL